MRTTLILLGALCLFLLPAKAQYHIRVDCYGYDYYVINFTNDNWKTSNHIMETFELTNYATDNYDDYRSYTDQTTNPLLREDKHELISIAKRLKTFESCKKWNGSVTAVYARRHKYFMSIKPKFKPYKLAVKKHCCTTTKIY